MYVRIDFWRFLLGLLIVSVPVAVLERSGDEAAADAYILLIMILMLVANWQGVTEFSRFIRRETGGV